MTEPCKQERTIGTLEATIHAIQQTLETMRDGQAQFIAVLEKIASQGTDIASLKSGQDTLFNRVRDVELKAESDRTKIGIIVAGISAGISAVVAFFTGR